MILKEKFTNFVGAVKNILPSGFRKEDDAVQLTFDEMSDVSLWMEKEKFLNFRGMRLNCPQGFDTYYIDHIVKLENVWNIISTIPDGILRPTSQLLAGLATKPELLSNKAGFTLRTFNYPLKNINPDDLIKLLSASYKAASTDTQPIEVLFHSASEIDVAYTRAASLKEDITKRMISDVSRINDSIVASTEEISEHAVDSRVAEQLAQLIDINDKWVQLFGLFMKQTADMFHALNLTGEKLKVRKAKK